MAKLRSSSNEILNCRTIDDGSVDNLWYIANLELLEDDSLSVRSVESALDGISCYKNNIISASEISSNVDKTDEEMDLAQQAYSAVRKGFETVITTANARENLLVKLPEHKRLYNSDMAPKIALQVGPHAVHILTIIFAD